MLTVGCSNDTRTLEKGIKTGEPRTVFVSYLSLIFRIEPYDHVCDRSQRLPSSYRQHRSDTSKIPDRPNNNTPCSLVPRFRSDHLPNRVFAPMYTRVVSSCYSERLDVPRTRRNGPVARPAFPGTRSVREKTSLVKHTRAHARCRLGFHGRFPWRSSISIRPRSFARSRARRVLKSTAAKARPCATGKSGRFMRIGRFSRQSVGQRRAKRPGLKFSRVRSTTDG